MSHNLKTRVVRGSGIDDLAYEIQQQADELFPNRTDDSMLLKLHEEIGEFAKARSVDELADVLIMLLDYGSRHLFPLEFAIRTKMHENQDRKWVERNGVFQHE